MSEHRGRPLAARPGRRATTTIRAALAVVVAVLVAAGLLTGAGHSAVVAQILIPGSGPRQDADLSPTPPRPTLVIRDFSFVPADLTVPAGASVRVENEDDVAHTLTVADVASSTDEIPAHGSAELVTPSRSGTYVVMDAALTIFRATLTVT